MLGGGVNRKEGGKSSYIVIVLVVVVVVAVAVYSKKVLGIIWDYGTEDAYPYDRGVK